MFLTRHFKLTGILILAILAASCSAGKKQPQIANAGLYKDPEGRELTTSFSWRIPFYCIVSLVDAPADTVVQASWIAMDTNRLAPETVIKIEEKSAQEGRVVFELVNEGNFWPIGDYQINLYLNGKLAQELEFEVYHTDDVY